MINVKYSESLNMIIKLTNETVQEKVLSTNLFVLKQPIHKPTLPLSLYDINEVSFHAPLPLPPPKKRFPSSDCEPNVQWSSSIQQMFEFKLLESIKFPAFFHYVTFSWFCTWEVITCPYFTPLSIKRQWKLIVHDLGMTWHKWLKYNLLSPPPLWKKLLKDSSEHQSNSSA